MANEYEKIKFASRLQPSFEIEVPFVPVINQKHVIY